jgi:hypothetical protein
VMGGMWASQVVRVRGWCGAAFVLREHVIDGEVRPCRGPMWHGVCMCGVVCMQMDGRSALCAASAAGYVEAGRALLEAGVDMGQADVGVVL